MLPADGFEAAPAHPVPTAGRWRAAAHCWRRRRARRRRCPARRPRRAAADRSQAPWRGARTRRRHRARPVGAGGASSARTTSRRGWPRAPVCRSAAMQHLAERGRRRLRYRRRARAATPGRAGRPAPRSLLWSGMDSNPPIGQPSAAAIATSTSGLMVAAPRRTSRRSPVRAQDRARTAGSRWPHRRTRRIACAGSTMRRRGCASPPT